MRRVTWLKENPRIIMPGHSPLGRVDEFLYRQPMQRTEYYMPWGTVTVDELCKMEYDLDRIMVTFCDERCAWHGRP